MFIAGEPQTLLSKGDKSWRQTIASFGIHVEPELCLRFAVSSYYRRGHPFDLDNLVDPVLDVLAPEVSLRKSLWATVELADTPGVEIAHLAPPPAPKDSLLISLMRPPLRSVRTLEPLAELKNIEFLGSKDAPCGCFLTLGYDVRGLVFGFEGPIKPTIDALWPILGGSHHQPADHRIRDLRVLRDNSLSGINVALWLL